MAEHRWHTEGDRTRRRARRGTRHLARPLLAAAVVVAGLGPASPSGAASTFTASAGGEVVRALVRLVPPLLQEDLLDPGALAAQAQLTSFGESTAFASHPYPGSLPVAAPGIVDGLLASTPDVPPELAELLNLPEYPLIASSSHPATPTATLGAGPVVLRAESRERESVGSVGDGVNRTEARIVADRATDVVTASAVTEVGSVDLGPLVKLSGIRSAATVRQAADGDLERSTEFSVASLDVLGQRLRITPDGLELAGLHLPLGIGGLLDPVEGLLSALQAHGTSVRFLEATETPEGVVSAGLEVTSTFNTGVNDIVATVAMTLGRTHASVSNAARPPVGGDEPFAPAAPAPATPSPAPPGPDLSPPVDPAAGGDPVAPSSPSGPGGGGATAPRPIVALVPDTTDAGRTYPVLVVGGAVLLIGISLFRKIGVRSPWTS